MNKLILSMAVIVLVGVGITYVVHSKKETIKENPDQSDNIVCTMEAKACPDGSYVGRSGPTCEFAPCPDVQTKGGTTPNPGVGQGTVSGTVTTGPTCPVERIPPDPQCAPRPYATSIAVKKTGGVTVIKTIKSDASGRFSVQLNPGSYELDPASGSMFPRCASVTVQVKSGQTVVANISCDTGIR